MSAAQNDDNRTTEQSLASRGQDGMTRARRRGRSIAVSGANTFLGRNLIGLLAEDDSVSRIVVVDLRKPETLGPKTSFYEIDLTQPGVESRLAELLNAEAVDTFVHLAFLENPTQATAWGHELESVGTMHVLHACHKRKLAKLVVVSSALVYGAHPDNPNFLSEDRPLRGLRGAHFVSDKIDVEEQVRKFAEQHPSCAVTVLRFSPVLGPSVRNYVTRWLSRGLVPTVLGYDPLVQFVHEVDALSALKLAVIADSAGVFNIASDGVLPISTVIKLLGRVAVPLPYGLLRRAGGLLWVAQLSEAPPSFTVLLRYLCVTDRSRAQQVLGFRPVFSTRDAVLDLGGALRLREAKLLSEAT
ncbi:MAG TPA: NAD-dependent epimerase/dehydratase family protein [Polyangiales bacterium]